MGWGEKRGAGQFEFPLCARSGLSQSAFASGRSLAKLPIEDVGLSVAFKRRRGVSNWRQAQRRVDRRFSDSLKRWANSARPRRA